MLNQINNFKKIVLDNGLTIILYQIKEVKSVFIACSIKSGNDYIKDTSQIGLAHFLEHLSFSSTEKYKNRKEINRVVDNIGAYINASTNVRGTYYWIKAPYINVSQSIDILHQLIFKSFVTDSEIEKEKKIVLSEYRDSQANEISVFNQKIQKNRFKNIPQYQSPPIGEPLQISSFTKEMIKGWKKTFYNPNNIILSVVGNFEEEKVTAQIKNTFGKERKGRKFEFSKYGNNKYSDSMIHLQKNNSSQIYLDINWPAFGWCEVSKHEEMVLKVLNSWLGRGPGSMLSMKLREEKGLTYSSGSSLIIFPYLGGLEIYATIEKSSLKKAIDEIEKILKNLKSRGISKNDLERTKESMKLHDYLNFESPESICWYLMGELFDYGKIWNTEDYARETEKVTVSETKELAKKIFVKDRMNISLLGDIKKSETSFLDSFLVK